jgi:hypothetical protein
MMQSLRNLFSPEQRRTIGVEARQLLENHHFKEALEAIDGNLVAQAKGCDPDDKDKCQRVVIAMQIAEGIKREIVRKIEDGDMAQIEIRELERKNKPLRFIR